MTFTITENMFEKCTLKETKKLKKRIRKLMSKTLEAHGNWYRDFLKKLIVDDKEYRKPFNI